MRRGQGSRARARLRALVVVGLDDAACAGHDPRLWAEPDRAAHGGITDDADPAQVRRAKTICAACPCRVECGLWALEHDELGIWGGMTRAERNRIRAQIEEAVE